MSILQTPSLLTLENSNNKNKKCRRVIQNIKRALSELEVPKWRR